MFSTAMTMASRRTASSRRPEEVEHGARTRYVALSAKPLGGCLVHDTGCERTWANSNFPVGGLPSSDSSPEDAVQAHRRSFEENGAGLPPTLPSAQPRQQPPQAHHFMLFRLLFRTLSHSPCCHPFSDPGMLVPRFNPASQRRKLWAQLARPHPPA
jgi:hypothetical protein